MALNKKTIQELVAFNTECDVQAVEGFIKVVYKCGTPAQGKFGQYWYQDLILEDGGAQIKAVFATRPEVPTADQGKRICILGTKTKFRAAKGGGQDLVLYVGDKCSVVPATDMGSATAPANPPQQPPQGAPAQPSTARAPWSKPAAPQSAPAPNNQPATRIQKTPQQAVADGWKYLESVGNFLQLAWEQAKIQKDVWEKNHPELPWTNSNMERAVAGFCQGADRIGIPASIPPGDISKYFPLPE